MCRLTAFAFTGLIVCPIAGHAAILSPEEASSPITESATVCGLVASAAYAALAPGAPTFLNLGRAYPDQVFTAVVLGSDRAKFGTPEISMREKEVCVTGKIFLFQGNPGMMLRDRKQIEQR
jgi:hypothetical protein